jgi:hypothetical protein
MVVKEYNLNNILKEFDMSFYNFQTMCILSGTDYNKSSKSIFSYYNKFKKTNKLVENEELEKVNNIRFYFNKEDNVKIDMEKVKINDLNNNKLQEILELDNFIFPEM